MDIRTKNEQHTDHHDFASAQDAMGFYESILESLGANCALVDEQGNLLFITQEALPDGVDKHTTIGKKFFEVFPHLVEWGYPESIQRVLESGKSFVELYTRHTTAGGLSGYFHRKFYPVTIPGRGKAVVAIIENVSEHRLAELHAHESEFRYQRLIETMNLVSFRFDATGRFTYLNKACLEIFEWSSAEMIGTSVVQYVHPEDVGELWRVFWQVVNHDQQFGTVENRIVTRTGTVKHMRWNIHPVYDGEGKIIGSQGVGEDITASKQVMHNLQQSYGKYKGFFNALPVPVCIVSKEDKIMSVNRSMCKMLSYSQKEMQEKTIFDILPLASIDIGTRVWTQLKNKGGMPRQPFTFLRKDRIAVHVMLNGVRFGDYFMLISERSTNTSHSTVA